MRINKFGCLQVKIMNYILVIAAACAVVSSSLAQPCPTSKTEIKYKCLDDNNMDMSDYIKYKQDVGFVPEKIKAKCSMFPEYNKVYECISAEFMRCSIEDEDLPPAEDVSEMGKACNDSDIQYECIEKVPRLHPELKSCMAAHSSKMNPATHTPEEMTCETAKVSVQCVVDLLAKCDNHTASLVSAMSKVHISSWCARSIVG